MSSTSENNKRIAKNTAMLYFRMFIVMGITLYTSRVVLNILGVEDFGIYNIVGGVIALLGFISSSMSISVQRFLSYEMGKGNLSGLSRIFSMSVNIHLLIAIVVGLALETVGCWFLINKLNIASDRLDAALVVFHLSTITCCFHILQVPFMALMIAYERMNLYAYISIVEVFLKLLVAILLSFISYDALIVYGWLLLFVTIIVTSIYIVSCKSSFTEIRYQKIWDAKLFSSLSKFASWSALGEMAWGFTLQGVNIILNLFFGTVANAAYGISSQVSGAVYRFVGSFQTALNPQLIKIYAQGDVFGMMSLAYRGLRFSFFLLLLVVIPLVAEMHFILKLWLGIVPDYALVFCQLVVINALLDILSNLFATLAKAYGKIRNYQLLVSLFLFLNFPLSYLVLKMGGPSYTVFIVYSVISVLLIVLRIYLISKMFHINVWKDYIKQVIYPVSKVGILSLVIPLLVWLSMDDGLSRFFLLSILSTVSVFVSIYTVGLNSTERVLVKSKINSFKSRIIRA